MTDFGLTDEYVVYDGLDQEEVKKHEQLCSYKLNSKFFTRTGRADPKGSRTFFFAAGAFVDNTIWVGNCLVATQCILNIVSEFFLINDIAINTNKTVVILINQRAREVFLSINGLSKPSLAKAYSDIRFFSNIVLRKVVTEKQFLYLVSAVLQLIIDKMLRKGLKLKANLPKDFPNEALYHLELYGLRTFKQMLAENILAGLVHSLKVPINLLIDPTNCFLAGVTCVLKLCNLSLGGDLPDVFQAKNSIAVLDVLGLESYLCVAKFLRKYGIVFVHQLLDCQGACFEGLGSVWFVLLVEFIKGSNLSNCVALSYCSALADSSCDFSYVNEHLLNSDLSSVTVYTDGSIKDLGSLDACGGAAAYFLDANVSIGVKVDGLLFSTLVKLQVIALVLECAPVFQSVNLFIDSQTSLDLYKSNGGVFSPDFCDKYWIGKEHIHHVISKKGLSVTWNKVKSHFGVVGNKCADFYANAAVVSKFFLPLVVPYYFLKVEDRPVSRNACHVAKKLFNAVHSVGWEAKCVGSFVSVGFCDYFDKAKTFCVWHPDGKIKSGYTSSASVILWLYLIKALYHHLLVTKKKRLYNPRYPSIVCIWCELVKDSDHVFFCTYNANVRKTLLSDTSMEWNVVLGIFADRNTIANSLHKAGSSINLFTVLVKDFVLKDWVADMVSHLGAGFGRSTLIVNFSVFFVVCWVNLRFRFQVGCLHVLQVAPVPYKIGLWFLKWFSCSRNSGCVVLPWLA
ncbi:hypothetical protein G9A89_003476 [Geosiphon pyriformis]|nr:hypothetical protein G9A89_003476 [Geosiphon pyriformis]